MLPSDSFLEKPNEIVSYQSVLYILDSMKRKRSRDTDFADNTCMLDTFSIDFLL